MESLSQRASRVMAPVANRVTELGITRAEGSHVWDEKGDRYIDFTCGVGVANLGHQHPAVIERAQSQMSTLVHAGHNVSYYPSYVELAERLAAAVPGDNRVYFSNGGAESIDGAIKLCVRATGRSTVLSFMRGFHGRTVMASALSTSSASYRRGYGGVLPPVHPLPYPYAFRSGLDEESEVARCLAAFDEHLAQVSDPQDVAAVVVEPVLGEGGYLPAPAAFLQGLRDRCTAHDIPLVLDEIQTGFGRTGDLFAFQGLAVEPDVLILAKGIANGFPLSALVARSSLTDRWPAGSHGGTYGGNPISCAAALAVLDAIDEPLLERARQTGQALRDGLGDAVRPYAGRTDVRGPGLMLGVEFMTEDGRPDAETVATIRSESQAAGLLLLACGPDRNVIRMIPALTVLDTVVEEALEVIAKAVRSSLEAGSG